MQEIIDEFRILDNLDASIREKQNEKIFIVDNDNEMRENKTQIKNFTLQELESTTRIKQYMHDLEENDSEVVQQEFYNKVARIGLRYKGMLTEEEEDDYLATPQREIQLGFLSERNKDLKNLEPLIQDLFLIFKQIQVLINDTAPQLEIVVEHTEKAVVETDEAVLEMQEAVKAAQRRRRAKCWILFIVIVILLVAVIAIATPLAIQTAENIVGGGKNRTLYN